MPGETPMRITFILPGVSSVPIGGYRVVYEYANRLHARGHAVTIVYPRHLGLLSAYEYARCLLGLYTGLRRWPEDCSPWFDVHPGVRQLPVPDPSSRSVPSADAVVATAWNTAEPVSRLPRGCGAKFYLVQHLETWSGPADKVMAT